MSGDIGGAGCCICGDTNGYFNVLCWKEQSGRTARRRYCLGPECQAQMAAAADLIGY